MLTLTIAVPYLDDIAEAIGIISKTDLLLRDSESVEWLLMELHPGRNAGKRAVTPLPARAQILPAAASRGFPAAKNAALKAASADLILFLSPPLMPQPGAIERLALQLRSHPELWGVCGRWSNVRGEIERGYNVRTFPTRRALFYDMLFINKIWPGNRSTRTYKMHDFDHLTPCSVEHALDYALLVQKHLVSDLGGFDEGYRFGWFDQVEFCQNAQRAGLDIWYDPGAVFEASEREPLLDRLLAVRYSEFYMDQQRYISRRFGSGARIQHRAFLAAGMLIRLGFAYILPPPLRKVLLTRYRSYVRDDYIQVMKSAYRATLRSALCGP